MALMKYTRPAESRLPDQLSQPEWSLVLAIRETIVRGRGTIERAHVAIARSLELQERMTGTREDCRITVREFNRVRASEDGAILPIYKACLRSRFASRMPN
jgi:hypothetical protein